MFFLVPKGSGPKGAIPIEETPDTSRHADELVVFHEAQVLPVFVLYT